MLRARLPSLLVLAVAFGCAARASVPVDPELARQLEKMKEAAAAPARPEPAPAETEKKPQPVTPPRSAAARIARARGPPAGRRRLSSEDGLRRFALRRRIARGRRFAREQK